jgi:F-type H+-transporting ATPase subunit delta
MNTATLARQSELDRCVDAAELTTTLAEELLEVADLLVGEPRLRNALSDPTTADQRRRQLVEAVLGGKLSAGALTVVGQAAALKWGSSGRLIQVLRRQALRVLLGLSQQDGRLDRVEEELFRLGRTTVASHELRKALDDHSVPVAARRRLVAELVSAKVDPITLALAEQAVPADEGTFALGIDEVLMLAAQARQRAIATVTVARPLTDEQQDRLAAVLVRQLGRQVNLQIVIDPNVIGGARVQVGDQVIEGTLASRLAAAAQHLTK